MTLPTSNHRNEPGSSFSSFFRWLQPWPTFYILTAIQWETWSQKHSAKPLLGFHCGSVGKESACNVGDLGSIPGLGRSPGEGKGYPFQYSDLENSMDCIGHGVIESDMTKWLSLSSCFQISHSQKLCKMINVCCFKLLSWGIICYASVGNQCNTCPRPE